MHAIGRMGMVREMQAWLCRSTSPGSRNARETCLYARLRTSGDESAGCCRSVGLARRFSKEALDSDRSVQNDKHGVQNPTPEVPNAKRGVHEPHAWRSERHTPEFRTPNAESRTPTVGF